MLRILIALTCATLLTAGEPPDIPADLARALAGIAARGSISRSPGGFVPWPAGGHDEFDVIDRCDPPTLRRAFAGAIGLEARVVTGQALIRSDPASADAVARECLFDQRICHRLDGCIGSTPTVADELVAAAWPELTDRQQWELLRTWSNRAVDDTGAWPLGGWNSGWGTLAGLIKSAGLEIRLEGWMGGAPEARRRFARLLWLSPDSADHARLTRLLADGDPEVRWTALQALMRQRGTAGQPPPVGDLCERALLAACADPDPRVRLVGAAQICARLEPGGKDVSTALIASASAVIVERCAPDAVSGFPSSLLPAIEAIAQHWHMSLPVEAVADSCARLIANLVASERPDLIETAARIAGRGVHLPGIAACLELLERPDAAHAAVLRGLAGHDIGWPAEHQERLLRFLAACDFTDQDIALAAIPCLGGTASQATRLVALLDDPRPLVAGAAYSALCTGRSTWALDALVARLAEPGLEQGRRCRLLANHFNEHSEATHALMRRTQRGDALRAAAAITLMQFDRKGESAAAMLLDLLDDPRASGRSEAARALRHCPALGISAIQRAPFRARFLGFIADPDPLVRVEVQREHLDSAMPPEFWRGGLGDADADVRLAASRGVAALHSREAHHQRPLAASSAVLRLGLADRDPLVRRTCARALCVTLADGWREGMACLLELDDAVTAGQVLEYTDRPGELMALLAPHIADRSWRWRLLAMHSGDQVPWSQLLGDPCRALREAAWQELPRGPTGTILPIGDDLRRLRDEAVRRDAALALEVLGTGG